MVESQRLTGLPGLPPLGPSWPLPASSLSQPQSFSHVVLILQCSDRAFAAHAQGIQFLIDALQRSSSSSPSLSLRLGTSEVQTVLHLERLVRAAGQIVPALHVMTAEQRMACRQNEGSFRAAFPHFNELDCFHLAMRVTVSVASCLTD